MLANTVSSNGLFEEMKSEGGEREGDRCWGLGLGLGGFDGQLCSQE